MKTPLFKKLLSILRLEAARSYSILDLGCGSGAFLDLVSTVVADDSDLVGIDALQDSIENALAAHPHIRFYNEKFIDSFSFPDASFDIIMSVDTIECIPNKAALVAEVSRVLRPAGRIIFAHWDWDTQVYNSKHRQVIRKFIDEFSSWQQCWMDAVDGQMGRQLWGLFEGSGVFTGTMDSFTLVETLYEKGKYGYELLQDLRNLVDAGRLSAAEHDMICNEMAESARSQNYFYSVNSYIYVGKKV